MSSVARLRRLDEMPRRGSPPPAELPELPDPPRDTRSAPVEEERPRDAAFRSMVRRRMDITRPPPREAATDEFASMDLREASRFKGCP